MTWNYRVLRYEDGTFGVHEVYYDEGRPTMYVEEPAVVFSESSEGLRQMLKAMQGALRKMPLSPEDFA